jgi:hypothetical protein
VGRLKVGLGLTSGQDSAAGIEGAERAGILNRRSQPEEIHFIDLVS